MSDIPYNYRKYIDDVTKMTQRGAISSGEQMQSPSSAGSRGLAKTMQFTNNKTQMQLGQEAIAESMVEIRNIMNRIDGVNVPVSEDDGDERAIAQMKTDRDSDYLYLRGKEIDQGSIMYKMEDYSDGIFELQSAKYADGTELDEKELEELESTQELIDWVMIDFVSESAVPEDEPGYYKNPDKEFNINGMTTKKDVVQSIIDNLDNNELDTARDSLNQLLDVVTALHEGGMPASIIKHKQKLAMMSDEELADRFKDFDEDKLRHMAWSHGYGKMSSHYWDRVQAGKKDDHREISRIMKYESKLADMLNQRLK